MSLAALLIACGLVVAGGTLVAVADWRVTPRGRSGMLERLWVILPAAFLVLLLVLAAREAWS
jgi:hypothetical protein